MDALTRRRFLQVLGFGTVAAAAAANSLFDVERALWIPSEKTIVIPPPPRGDDYYVSGYYYVSADWLGESTAAYLKRHATVKVLKDRTFTQIYIGNVSHAQEQGMLIGRGWD